MGLRGMEASAGGGVIRCDEVMAEKMSDEPKEQQNSSTQRRKPYMNQTSGFRWGCEEQRRAWVVGMQ